VRVGLKKTLPKIRCSKKISRRLKVRKWGRKALQAE
jgi:hypothetical protein